ncbi:hypothetical protein Pth03_06830 [Planotetraspora thailandica]|uniref:DUF1684 domain-containing protein n=1 Tax=Planotetraspora thailandica TaxID=487172 RepID=A0A8J3XTL1_9ACTN|nr:hypothetical protein Pth03_06830 [Planotetraspora thailandica]
MPALASTRTIESARANWDAWRASRLAAVTSPTGNLALVETRWSAPDANQSPEEALAGQPDTVTATTLERRHIGTGDVERGIRLWDADSPAIRHFETIDVFPFAPEWVIEATYTPVPGSRAVPFEHIRDNGGTRDLVVPGDITFTLDGVAYNLSAFDDEGTLLLVFGDPTNGSVTYGAGRFLTVPHEPGSGTVVLDFNQAFVPPCGFSVHYNCPLPPFQNRFPVPVEAGEKRPVFTGDFQPY